MSKFIAAFLLFFFTQIINAQKGIDQLILAEKNFAAYSVSHSTKEAFLLFLDSSGLVFDNGKPVNGIQTWNNRKKNPGVLSWYPQYAEISASDDFGYTTGPWTYQPSAKDSVVAGGRYITVWHIDKQGEWRLLVDLGVNNTPGNSDLSLRKMESPNPGFPKGSARSLVKREKKFIKEKDRAVKGNYRKYLSRNCILNRNNRGPANCPDSCFEVLSRDPENIDYIINGSGIASSGDLGYVYGTTFINSKTDNYLRIWRREKDGWKIAVEVLRY